MRYIWAFVAKYENEGIKLQVNLKSIKFSAKFLMSKFMIVSDEFPEPLRMRHVALVKLARLSPCGIARTRWDDPTEHPSQVVTDRSSNDDSLGTTHYRRSHKL